MEWEKIFAKDETEHGLNSRLYKQFIQLNKKKNKQPNPKMGRTTKQAILQ